VMAAGTSLVDMVYACLLGEADWQVFLDRLSAILPGGKSVFLFHDASRNEGGFMMASGFDQNDLSLYNDYYAPRNPWMKKAAVRPVGRGVAADQMLGRSDLTQTGYYWDFLKRIECESAVGVTIARDGSRSSNLSTLTDRVDPVENMAAAQVLTGLAPHIQRAFRFYRSNLTPSVSQQFAILDAAGIGLLLIGSTTRVLKANPIAEELLTQGEVGKISPIGSLVFRSPEACAAMREMLILEPRIKRSFSYYGSTAKGKAKITLVRLNKDAAAEFFAGPTVAVLIDILHMDAAEVAANLISKFGLTSAEARLAQAIDRGASVKEAAMAFGIREGTARQQLKAVFRKMGISRQSEMIRSMHDPTFRSFGE